MNNPSTLIKRNFGIDLLRIISMVYVLILHTLGIGGILKSLPPVSTQYKVFWFLEIWASCAVDIFVLISGFAGYSKKEKKPNYSKLILLWFEVVFYSAGIAIIYKYIHPNRVSAETIRNMFFPLTNEIYWFFCAYTGLFIMKPFLDAAVRQLENKKLKHLMAIFFLAFSCFSMFTNPFRLVGGYSFVWFMILYIFGASLKKLDVCGNISAKKAILGIICLSLMTWALKMLDFHVNFMNIHLSTESLISYVSPIIVLSAILHVILFSKAEFPSLVNKIISFLSTGTFSVYLINTHPCLWNNEFEDRFIGWASLPTAEILIRLLGFSCAFVLASLLIDKIRQLLFKTLRLQPALHRLQERINLTDRQF